MSQPNHLKVALAQIAPVWGNQKATLEKIKTSIIEASENGAELVIFGEGLLPGYPYWLSLMDGAAWDKKEVKELHAHYARNAVDIERGDLEEVCTLSRKHNIAIYLGVIERPQDRGGSSLYCSLVYINQEGEIQSVHRKLQPTYDERLTWAPGDGHGLRVHPLKQFTVGGLNCWENWMPLPRAAMYAQGENLHIAVWPGSDYNTKDITRFIARESRSYVISVSSRMAIATDFPKDTPHLDTLLKNAPERSSNGGSCIAGPDGEFILPPDTTSEGLIYHTLDFNRVYEERQNFDPSGHYSRPDVTQLTVNRERQTTVKFEE
ncbi:carbon-nitrogen hydrolase family protein [Dokdonia sinensis]|uniref:Carbon-nitrogen hydrolase family protein n=1 Tax=Dokdonia sinensis TaxID=2479847 RepID=A0A3M0G317_9FLAO|nr:carbon-nitrogen hydrolase family protein [Dokdonia sinensis]RMB58547.1 carbon-nitrogen hydrolase family protein [Dokdonia sinensis]